MQTPVILMLLTNAYDPDPRVRQEALALLGRGYRVTIIAWDRDLCNAATEFMEGVEVRRIFLASLHGRGNIQMLFYPLVYLKILWVARNTEFAAVHCHDLDTLLVGFALGKLRRVPVVYDAHENFTDMLEGNIHPLLRRVLIGLENFFLRRVNLLVTVGKKLQRYFADRGARHSVVVGNWKSASEYARTPPQNAAVRQALNIPDSAMIVACITQLFADRKISELLDAVDGSPGVYLVIGGKGALEPLVKQRAERNPRIKFVGFVTAEAIPAYTCASDVVYYGFDPANPNSRFSAPNKLFEALAAGRPLITGNFGEIAEIVRSNACGIVLESYTVENIRLAFERLQDTSTRLVMAENARRCGTMQESAAQILDHEYSKLLCQHPMAHESATTGLSSHSNIV